MHHLAGAQAAARGFSPQTLVRHACAMCTAGGLTRACPQHQVASAAAYANAAAACGMQQSPMPLHAVLSGAVEALAAVQDEAQRFQRALLLPAANQLRARPTMPPPPMQPGVTTAALASRAAFLPAAPDGNEDERALLEMQMAVLTAAAREDDDLGMPSDP